MTQNINRQLSIAANATVLTIAGSDPSGGAGLQADLKAFQQAGTYGMAVVSLLTVQNTQGVRDIQSIPTDLVIAQLKAVLEDIPPRLIKTGALGNADNILAISELLSELDYPLIVDPVMVSKHGHPLADQEAINAYREHLLPIATLVTPNRFEVERLLDRQLTDLQSIANAARDLQQLGPKYVLIKAGEFGQKRHHMYASSSGVVGLELESIDSKHTHGAGCCLSATIAARLALTMKRDIDDESMREAIDFAVAAVHHAIEFAPKLGKGNGPVESRALHIGS